MFNILRVATLTGGLAVAAVSLAAPASAGDAEYIARLERNHVSYMSQHDALSWGHSVCGALRGGTPVLSAIDLLKDGGGFTTRDAGTIVGAATTELCPDQNQNVMNWAHGQV